MNPEYAWINTEDAMLFVYLLVAIGSLIVGGIVGWLTANWRFDKIVRDIEEHVNHVGADKVG